MERDDLIMNESYALNAHHSEEDGKRIRRNIGKVTILLTLVTIVEVIMGASYKRDHSLMWDVVVTLFVILTLVKAGFIVAVFMHLHDEVKKFQRTILIPYLFFVVYMLVLITVIEGKWQSIIQILP